MWAARELLDKKLDVWRLRILRGDGVSDVALDPEFIQAFLEVDAKGSPMHRVKLGLSRRFGSAAVRQKNRWIVGAGLLYGRVFFDPRQDPLTFSEASIHIAGQSSVLILDDPKRMGPVGRLFEPFPKLFGIK